MSNILIVFEGEKTEASIFESLNKAFFKSNSTITSAFCKEVYQLFKLLKSDSDLDLFPILKEMEVNKEKLRDYKRDDFTEIYLFFDYDGHSNLAKDDDLMELLDFFDNETEKGKLYISYPMVEAIKHIESEEAFSSLKIRKVDCRNYKSIVDKDCKHNLKDFRKYGNSDWCFVVELHLKKVNLLVLGKFQYPEFNIQQVQILESQIDSYISMDQAVFVVSAFPSFLQEYFGNDKLYEKLKSGRAATN